MNLLVLYGVYEGDKNIAPYALEQLLTILAGHTVDVLILDDASPSRVGERLATTFKGPVPRRMDLLVREFSQGYRGSIDRTFGALAWIARCGRVYDYVLRVDTDIHFCRRDLAELFKPGVLPELGITGQTLAMRSRDLVQILMDILPVGFRRRHLPDRTIAHTWELSRFRPVWWQSIGWRALWHGFRGVILPGCFIAMSGKTLAEMSRRGWLDRPRASIGLSFGDDTIMSVATVALGHPITDLRTLIPDWSCDLFLTPAATAEGIREKRRYYVHPMKDAGWAMALREALPLA